MDSNRASTSTRRLRHACLAALLALGLGAQAMPAAAEPPMWVIKDADSTVYLFGTVHLLDPSIEWQTPRVRKALDDATQLWVEIAIPPGGELLDLEHGVGPVGVPSGVAADLLHCTNHILGRLCP